MKLVLGSHSEMGLDLEPNSGSDSLNKFDSRCMEVLIHGTETEPMDVHFQGMVLDFV